MARGTGGCVRVAQGLGARLSRGQGHQVVHAPTGAPPTLRLPVAGVVTDLFDISRCAINPPAPRGRGHRAPYAAGCRPPRGPGVLLRSLWTRGGTSPQPGNTGPARARVRGVRCLSSHSGSWLAGACQAAAPVSVPHMALSFSIMLERLEGSAAVMASWRERIKRRYSP